MRSLDKYFHREVFQYMTCPQFYYNYCFFFLFQWLCIPFLILCPAVTDITQTALVNQTSGISWIGELELADAGKWADEMLLLVRF